MSLHYDRRKTGGLDVDSRPTSMHVDSRKTGDGVLLSLTVARLEDWIGRKPWDSVSLPVDSRKT